jgi:hypothetical protein
LDGPLIRLGLPLDEPEVDGLTFVDSRLRRKLPLSTSVLGVATFLSPTAKL